MGAFTKLFNLFKPDYTDKPDIVKAVAENMDKIDAALGNADDAIKKKQDNLGIKAIGDNLSLDSSTGVLDAKAQKVTVDKALSATSENPIANKAVNAEIDTLTKANESLKNDLANKADNHVSVEYLWEELNDIPVGTSMSDKRIQLDPGQWMISIFIICDPTSKFNGFVDLKDADTNTWLNLAENSLPIYNSSNGVTRQNFQQMLFFETTTTRNLAIEFVNNKATGNLSYDIMAIKLGV